MYNVYNDDLFAGGHQGSDPIYLSDILQYNTTSNTWEEFGQMKEARTTQDIGVLEDVSQLCP